MFLGHSLSEQNKEPTDQTNKQKPALQWGNMKGMDWPTFRVGIGTRIVLFD